MTAHEPAVTRSGRGARPRRHRGPRPVETPLDAAPARWQPLAAALIVLAAWTLALGALTPVLAAGPWQGHALTVVALALVVPGAARTLVPRRPLTGVLLGLLAGVVGTLLIAHGGGGLGPWLTDPGSALQDAGGLARRTVPPMTVTGPFEVVVLAACLLLGWSCALMSAGGADQVGGTALVPGLALLAPPVLAARSAPGRTVVLLAVCVLLLIVTGAPRRSPSRSRPAPRSRSALLALRSAGGRLLAVGLALGLTTLLLPVVPEAVVVAPGQVRGGSTSADPTLTLGHDLVSGDDRTVLRYTDETDGAPARRSLRLTLAVIRDLDGTTWQPLDTTGGTSADSLQDPAGDGALTAGGALAAAGADPTGAGLERLRVTDVALASDRLPGLQSTVLVTDASGTRTRDWSWVTGTSTALTTAEPLERGASYTVLGWTSLAGQERTAQRPAAATPSAEALTPYTALPSDLPPEVSAQARSVVAAAGAGDPASEAIALADWFHGNGFAYDESAPGSFDGAGGSPMDTVRAFLRDRSGYCVHYAATFTLMARSLGLPTRIAVGYATRSDGAGTDVTGRELHAWPEVWLAGQGWTAFEPTPGGAGARADQADATVAGPTPTPSATAPEPTASAAATTSATAAAAAATPAGADGERSGDPWPLLRDLGRILLTALVLLLPAAVREAERRARRRRARSGPRPARSAWRELLAEARDLGVLTGRTPLRAQTPEAAAEALGAAVPGAAGAAARLARSVTEEHYRGGGAESDDVAGNLEEAVTALRSTVTAPRRALGRLAPRGLAVAPRERRQAPPSARG
ncbi:transglutaminase family protein [Actinomyces haliotis]|uniref:transglutaminase family protein n=1 Tax=Actinomyces haliotis TaxID=1280843 RepID=UPI00188E38A6|nr:transglutaminase domain-containing protein [Actinomyces haliotis]